MRFCCEILYTSNESTEVAVYFESKLNEFFVLIVFSSNFLRDNDLTHNMKLPIIASIYKFSSIAKNGRRKSCGSCERINANEVKFLFAPVSECVTNSIWLHFVLSLFFFSFSRYAVVCLNVSLAIKSLTNKFQLHCVSAASGQRRTPNKQKIDYLTFNVAFIFFFLLQCWMWMRENHCSLNLV